MPHPESYADDLRSQGIDPESFLKVASEAAERIGESREEEVLGRLAAFAEEMHAAGWALYFPFESNVRPLSKIFAGRPDEFIRVLDDLAAIAADLGEEATMTLQRGIPALCHCGAERPWMIEASIRLARALGAAGVDPGNTLTESVHLLAESIEEDRELFRSSLDALRRFVLDLDEMGVHATYPIQQGIRGTIYAWVSELDGLPEALEDLRDLVRVLQDSELSAYRAPSPRASVDVPRCIGASVPAARRSRAAPSGSERAQGRRRCRSRRCNRVR